MELDPFILSRIQFAANISFHIRVHGRDVFNDGPRARL